MWIPAALVVVMGVISWQRFGSATSFAPHNLIPSTHLNDIIFWSVLMFALTGSESASLMGDEIKNPRRTIPAALFVAGITIAACYILGTVGVLLALPAAEVGNLQGLMQAISHTADRIGFAGIVPIAALTIALSNLGGASAFLTSVARLPFVAGIDHFLPPIFGSLHPRWRTPWFSLLLQFALGMVFVFLGQAGTSVKGAYDVLVSMSVITAVFPFLFLFGAMFKLQSEPAGPEVIRVPGGALVAKIMACMGLLATLLAIALSLLPQPDEPNKPLAVLKIVGSTAVILGVGAWIYWAGRRKNQQPKLNSSQK